MWGVGHGSCVTGGVLRVVVERRAVRLMDQHWGQHGRCQRGQQAGGTGAGGWRLLLLVLAQLLVLLLVLAQLLLLVLVWILLSILDGGEQGLQLLVCVLQREDVLDDLRRGGWLKMNTIEQPYSEAQACIKQVCAGCPLCLALFRACVQRRPAWVVLRTARLRHLFFLLSL